MLQAKNMANIHGISDFAFRLVKDKVLSRQGQNGGSIVYGNSHDACSLIWKTMSAMWEYMRGLNGWVDDPVPQFIEEHGGEDFFCPNCGWHTVALSKYDDQKCKQCEGDMFIDF